MTARTRLAAFLLALTPIPTAALGDDGMPGRPPVSTLAPTREEYRERRKALMEQIRVAEAAASVMRSTMLKAEGGPGPTPAGAAGVVIALMGRAEPGEDAKFRQENDFWYLTGVDSPHAALILWPESGDEALYLPPPEPADRALERAEAGTRDRGGLGPGIRAGRVVGVVPRRPVPGDRRRRRRPPPRRRRRST